MKSDAMSGGIRHITSLVVFAHPDRHDSVDRALQRIAGADVSAGDLPGRFIVCLESETLAEATAVIDVIRETRGVNETCLVFHQQEQADRLDETVSVASTTVREVTQ